MSDPLELPPPCELCGGNGRRLEFDLLGFTYRRCRCCAGRGYTGARRDLVTPVLAWATREGFAWPEASSSEPRGVLRRGALSLPTDAIAGSLGYPPSSGSNTAGDAVA
jgi:hypothetical protein